MFSEYRVSMAIRLRVLFLSITLIGYIFFLGLNHLQSSFLSTSKYLSLNAQSHSSVLGVIAGFIAAVVAIVVGLSFSYVVPKEHVYGWQLGEPLLLQGLAWLMFGPIPSTHNLVLHPIAFAAWFGFFVTAINLLPLGQLDGGHVAFAVFGRQQRQLAYVTVPILIYLGLTGWPGWIVWVGMAGIVGLAHPPVTDPDVGLGKGRRWVAWGALVIFIITFAPVPFSVG